MLDNRLNFESLRRYVPSIFTESSADHTSEKYQHISTANIVEQLMAKNFMPVWAAQSNARSENKKLFSKHMLRFRHVAARPTASGLYSELVLVNSHDGLSSYRLMAGVYRIVCSNGLIAGASYDDIRIRHQGDIIKNVIEGTYEVINNAEKMIKTSETMAATMLSVKDIQTFADAAYHLRFPDSKASVPFKPEQLLRPRRFEEAQKNDLFTIFNVVQENIMKGGLIAYVRDKNSRIKRTRSRSIHNIDHSIRLNRELWSLAEKMMDRN